MEAWVLELTQALDHRHWGYYIRKNKLLFCLATISWFLLHAAKHSPNRQNLVWYGPCLSLQPFLRQLSSSFTFLQPHWFSSYSANRDLFCFKVFACAVPSAWNNLFFTLHQLTSTHYLSLSLRDIDGSMDFPDTSNSN